MTPQETPTRRYDGRREKTATNLLNVIRRHRGPPKLQGLSAGPKHARQDRCKKRIGAHLKLPQDQARLDTRL